MTKWLSLAIAALFACALGACSNGGSASPLIPNAIPQSQTGASADPAISAPSTTLSTDATSSVPSHVQTAEYLWSSTEESTSPSTYAPYLTWAYTKGDRAGLTRSAGIKVVLYTTPIMPESGSYEYNELTGTYSSVRAKSCTGSYVTTYGGKGYLSDPRTSSAASYYTNIVDHAISVDESANPGYSHPYDLVFLDNAGELYGVSATPCDFSVTTWNTDLDSALKANGQPLLLNALSTSDADVSTYVARLNASNIEGGEYEHCFTDGEWTAEEDSQLQTVAALKAEGKSPGAGFWCYVDGSGATGAGSSYIPQRLFEYASFLLTYDPNYSVFEEAYSTPSTFKVFPETGFVPTNPAILPTGITGLATGNGAYVQKYGNCYYRGSSVGSCEIAVNPSSSSVSIPNSYPHSMVLSGGGVLDGGSASFSGPAITSLAAKSAAILIGGGTSATPAPTASPSSSGAYSYTGSVNAVESSTEFHVDFGGSCGYNYVTTTNATVSGGPVAVGDTVAVTSSSNCFASPIVATAVSVNGATTAAKAVYSYTGTVNWVTSGKFHADFGGSCGSNYVTYTSSTSISGTIAIGKSVTVGSAANCFASPIAATSITVN